MDANSNSNSHYQIEITAERIFLRGSNGGIRVYSWSPYGSPPATPTEPSGCFSASTTALHVTSHRWAIRGLARFYSQIISPCSPLANLPISTCFCPANAKHLQFTGRLHLYGSEQHFGKALSLELQLKTTEATAAEQRLIANVNVSILDINGQRRFTSSILSYELFSILEANWSSPQFISLDALHQCYNELVLDDQLTILFEVRIEQTDCSVELTRASEEENHLYFER